MIPGVGRYSMLITPRAGSLFHAVFQRTGKKSVTPLVYPVFLPLSQPDQITGKR